jgi:hypothetical protein
MIANQAKRGFQCTFRATLVGALSAAALLAAGACGSSAPGDGVDAGGAGDSGSGGNCPAGTTFCTGFEYSGALPGGTTYIPQEQAAAWEMYMFVDLGLKRAGAHSLLVRAATSTPNPNPVRLLAVGVPGPTFWARLHVGSTLETGQAAHNIFLQAMTGIDYAGSQSVRVAERDCQLVLEQGDEVVYSHSGSAASCTDRSGLRLDENVWHCVEAFFDGPNGEVEVFADGVSLARKTGWPALSFDRFAFGFVEEGGPARNTWYDDVAVSARRLGCP